MATISKKAGTMQHNHVIRQFHNSYHCSKVEFNKQIRCFPIFLSAYGWPCLCTGISAIFTTTCILHSIISSVHEITEGKWFWYCCIAPLELVQRTIFLYRKAIIFWHFKVFATCFLWGNLLSTSLGWHKTSHLLSTSCVHRMLKCFVIGSCEETYQT